ncbi:hypothetical protein [Nannocystis pusilla]|uniref:hypothetical protein n=1 Tax=Nannocystis pusilla TaxID=889268 RepID=UPI003B779B6D
MFDALPPSGARRGGDPSEYAFNRTLDTFVREALQNANDQSLSREGGRAEVYFDLEELEGRELKEFRMALGWDELHRHLRGAAAVKSISKFRPFAGGSPVQNRLVLMRVEDRHTSGLVGEEGDGDSNFRALCRDSLFSHKQSEAAGGSYGLGKSVYWSFSSHSTVIFHSCLHEGDGPGRHRLIGRVELPSHVIDDKHYMGPGWFGEPQKVDNGERAVSVWEGQALDLARRLRITRPPKVTGTTILVAGFRDPTSEGQDELPALLERIRRSAAEFFWPAMHFPRPLRVFVGGQPVAVTDAVSPFVTAWQQRGRAGTRLEKPGDIVRQSIPLHLPRRRADKDGPDQPAECELIVRLAEPNKPAHNSETLDNRVALFRGPGMVVRYLPVDPSGLMPRFHAILACGEGRTPSFRPPATSTRRRSSARASLPATTTGR